MSAKKERPINATGYVYALVNCVNETIFYIGKTYLKLPIRMSQHSSNSIKMESPVVLYIQECKKRSIPFKIISLHEISCEWGSESRIDKELREKEAEIIMKLHSEGVLLMNWHPIYSRLQVDSAKKAKEEIKNKMISSLNECALK